MPKKILIAIPPALLAQIDFVSESEHRTRSDLVREALRRYVAAFRLPEIASCVQATTELPTDTSQENRRAVSEQSYTSSTRIAG